MRPQTVFFVCAAPLFIYIAAFGMIAGPNADHALVTLALVSLLYMGFYGVLVAFAFYALAVRDLSPRRKGEP